MFTLAIGNDHAGFELKQIIKKHLIDRGFEVLDFGCHNGDSVDYPDFAWNVSEEVTSGRARFGILICGTGIGISIAANKVPGVRAALCHDRFTAQQARAHNDANILCLGGRILPADEACHMVDIFLETDFENGRHQLRINKISAIEHNNGNHEGRRSGV